MIKNKFILVALTVVLSAAILAGCSQTAKPETERLSIVTTIFPAYDFAKTVAAENADITMLIKPGAEMHSYEPSPKDIIKIKNCDLFIYVGGDSDNWVDRVLDSVDTEKIQIIKMMDVVEVREEEIVEGMEHTHHHEDGEHHHEDEHHEDGGHHHEDEQHEDGEHHHEDEHHEDGEHHHEDEQHEDGEHHHEDERHEDGEHHHEDEHHHGEYDEHVWTDPNNAILISQAIRDKLIFRDDSHKQEYTDNTEAFNKELKQLDDKFRQVVDQAKRKTLVFGDRFPVRYFVEAYGLEYYAAFPGCSSETEVSASTIKFLIDKVKQESIPVVFYIELSNQKVADAIVEETGAKKLLFNSCHNLTADQFKEGTTYLGLMTHNLEVLKEALN